MKFTERERHLTKMLLLMDKSCSKLSEKLTDLFGGDSFIAIELVKDDFIFEALEIGTSDVAINIVMDYINEKLTSDQAVSEIEELLTQFEEKDVI
ncbi:hypothetical protein ABHP49_004773 [Bacillus cereus]|uniref:hypothetical protein n=1 Tax=Bacillus TaxID=1386 RepID=UPI000278FC64|nr:MULTISPECIES: hypothetical protein [Bacillus]ASK14450.1 hypothetical protein BA201_11295 [Bacillus cereus]EJQ06643.1 hypothetical protein IE1_03269 [Bacillus cereus BAG3O-2]EJQ27958.1 hypothetical protein IE7_02067 [Bacillus cereus BAG4O-1]MBL3782099.1 hypothetical protein [Bacillus cereus]MBL3800643.1 hypothetical protein [Bacillus cereus]